MKYSPNKGQNQKKANWLIKEKSPYLLQHAENPVEWYPWGEGAFKKADTEDKPIFLSIGYSTCHWCHVMAHESFEDEEVAKMMNETFVSIKVDREERPDIDGIYMKVCQILTGTGGWPLTIIMTPGKKPFFAGTYFPKESRFGRIGMLKLIPRIRELWNNHREELLSSADQIMTSLQKLSIESQERELGESTLTDAYEEFVLRFDEVHGGFSSAPKFPTPHNLLFLLRYWKRTKNEKAKKMVETTLNAMLQGGIYDHIGFGFHRYSTDSGWLVPHFEKMLYDQALLLMAFTEAYQVTGNKELARAAKEIITYVVRDMTSPEGGFYSAEDADSEGMEGKFYIWTEEEIRKILDKEQADMIIKVFNISKDGNYHEEATGKKAGENILNLNKSHAWWASHMGIQEKELRKKLESARRKLFDAREKRIHPHKDDKILTDWNGLMVAAFAKAAGAFQEEEYITLASKAVDFIFNNLRSPDGRLLHRFRDGEADIPAYLDDYAFMIMGLIELYEISFDVHYLKKALELNDIILKHFWDEDKGGFFFTADDSEQILIRQKEIHDGAIPSGNSVSMLNLLKLSRITAVSNLEEKAWTIGRIFSENIQRSPSAFTQLLSALDFALGPSYEVVVVGDSNANDTKLMLKVLQSRFIPNKIMIFIGLEKVQQEIQEISQFTRHHTSINGKATAYVCHNYMCQAPTTDVEEMLKLLDAK